MSTAIHPTKSNSQTDRNASPRRRNIAGFQEDSTASLAEIPILLRLPDLSEQPFDIASKDIASKNDSTSQEEVTDSSSTITENLDDSEQASSNEQLTQSEIESLASAPHNASDSETADEKKTETPARNIDKKQPSSRRTRTGRRENRRRRVEKKSNRWLGSAMQLLLGILLLGSLGSAYLLLVSDSGNQNAHEEPTSIWNNEDQLQMSVSSDLDNTTESAADDSWTWSNDSQAASEDHSHSDHSDVQHGSSQRVAKKQDPHGQASASNSTQQSKTDSHFLPWRHEQENPSESIGAEASNESPMENISSDYPSTDLPPLEGVLLRSLQTLHRNNTPGDRTAKRGAEPAPTYQQKRNNIDHSGGARDRDIQSPLNRTRNERTQQSLY